MLARIGQLKQEFYYEIVNPVEFIEQLRKSDTRIDIFTFLEKFPPADPPQDFFTEMDNFAVIPISTFDQWQKHQIPKATRRGLRKAKEHGMEVRWVPFDDELVRRIWEIFNESPVRQGQPFWHYGKDIQAVKEILSRDQEWARYLGAFIGDEMVGFIKLLTRRNFARTTLILSKIAHRDKYPNNSLIAKAVEVCTDEKIPYLVYGQIEYGKVGSKSLADFKTNNGFQKFPLPRYYVPLSLRGKLVLKLRLHHGVIGLAPKWLVQGMLRLRNWVYAKKVTPTKTGSIRSDASTGDDKVQASETSSQQSLLKNCEDIPKV